MGFCFLVGSVELYLVLGKAGFISLEIVRGLYFRGNVGLSVLEVV